MSIVTSSLPSDLSGAPYKAVIAATNGTAPYLFSVVSGTLPPGIVLSPAGVLSGTPTAAGAFAFNVQVADSGVPQAKSIETLAITVVAPLMISTRSLGTDLVGNPYSTAIQFSGGVAPYTVALTSGSLPAGLTLSNSGLIAGTPTAEGTFPLSIAVMDSYTPQQTAAVNLTLTVVPPPLEIGVPGFSIATVGMAYMQTATASGGTPPYTFSIASGGLPAGLTLSTTGSIAGTPTATGNDTAVVQVSDSSTPQLTLTATVAIDSVNSTVQVNAAKTLATVPLTGFGMHASVYDPGLSDTALLPTLLATSGIKMLRYPGGQYADVYHWAQYAVTPFFPAVSPACSTALNPNAAQNGYLAPDADFATFVQVLEATGTEGIVTVNYGSSVANSAGTVAAGTYGSNCSEPNTGGQPQEAAAWVAYANGSAANTQVIGKDATGFDWKTVGFWAGLRGATPLPTDDGYNFLRLGQTTPLRIEYWELGNEVYYNGYNNNLNTETDLHAPYIYPAGYGAAFNSRAGVAALSPTAYGQNAIAYLQAMHAVDPTIKIGLALSSPGVDSIPASWNPAALQAVCAGTTFDFAILHYYPGSYNAVQATQLLSLPQTDMPGLVSGLRTQLAQYCPANAAAVQVFVTETGPNGSYASGVPTQITGLYALHEYLTSLEAGVANIDWLELHNGTFLTVQTEAPDPAFYGIELAHQLASVGDALVPAESNSSTLIAHGSRKTNGVTGVLLLNANPSAANVVAVSVTGATLGSTASIYSYGIATSQSGPVLSATSFQVPGNTFTVTVPAYTAVELLIP